MPKEVVKYQVVRLASGCNVRYTSEVSRYQEDSKSWKKVSPDLGLCLTVWGAKVQARRWIRKWASQEPSGVVYSHLTQVERNW